MSKNGVIKTMNLCLVFAVPPVIALVIFATYVYNKGPFDSVFSFTVLSLFNTLRFPLVVLPKALRGTSGETMLFGYLHTCSIMHGHLNTFQGHQHFIMMLSCYVVIAALQRPLPP